MSSKRDAYLDIKAMVDELIENNEEFIKEIKGSNNSEVLIAIHKGIIKAMTGLSDSLYFMAALSHG